MRMFLYLAAAIAFVVWGPLGALAVIEAGVPLRVVAFAVVLATVAFGWHVGALIARGKNW